MPASANGISLSHALEQAKAWCIDCVSPKGFGLLNVLSGRPIPWDVSIDVATRDAASLAAEVQQRRTRRTRGDDESGGAPRVAVPHPRDQLIDDLLRQNLFRRVAITGEGGAGKSEYTRRVAYRLAEHFLRHPGDPRSLVPLHVRLLRLNPAVETESNAQALFERLATDVAGWLAPLANVGRVAFILDGFDELRLDRSSFYEALLGLIRQYERCCFILTGRPGSIPLRDLRFSEKEEQRLQLLTDTQIRSYAQDYFSICKNPDLAPAFWSELQAKRSTLFPLVQTPFMLAFTVAHFQDHVDEPEKIPANPAALIEAQLRTLFAERKGASGLPGDTVCLQSLSTLAAFALVNPCKDKNANRIRFSRQEAVDWLRNDAPHNPYFVGKADLDLAATELINALAPASGVLYQSGNDIGFTNKVFAEFLAARWIANYGYPNWPYGNKGEHYIDPTVVSDNRERQLFDFFGDHAWTMDFGGLVQATRYQLGKRPNSFVNEQDFIRHVADINLLVRCGRWYYKSALPFDCRENTSLDARASLIDEAMQSFQALPDRLIDAHATAVDSVLRALIPIEIDWSLDGYWSNWLGKLPMMRRRAYFSSLTGQLAAVSLCATKNHRTIGNLARLMVSSFANDSTLRTRASAALTDALAAVGCGARDSWDAICELSGAIASGFAGDSTAISRASEALADALIAANGDPAANWRAIVSLSQHTAQAFGSNSAMMEQASEALANSLAEVSADPIGNMYAIAMLSYTIASWFGCETALMKQAKKALSAALAAASGEPTAHWRAIYTLSGAIASSFACTAALKKQAFELLTAALAIASHNPTENGTAISFAQMIVSGFANDRALRTQASTALTDALAAARGRPIGNWNVIDELSVAIASGFPDDATATKCASEAVIGALAAASGNPTANWQAINILSRRITQTFGGNPMAMAQASEALANSLTYVSDDPKENCIAVACLSETIASGFTGQSALMKLASEALAGTLGSLGAEPWANRRAISRLSGVIVRWFAHAPALKKQAFESLAAVLAIARDDSDENRADIRALSRNIAWGFAGDIDAAARIIRCGEMRLLDIDVWTPWVVLWGDESELKRYFIRSWRLSSDLRLLERIDWNRHRDSKYESQAVVVAPREKIRRGLPAWVLSEILAKDRRETSLDDQRQHPVEPVSPFVPRTCQTGTVATTQAASDSPPRVPYVPPHHELREEIVRLVGRAGEEGISSSGIASLIRKAVEKDRALEELRGFSTSIHRTTITAWCESLEAEGRIFSNDKKTQGRRWIHVEFRSND